MQIQLPQFFEDSDQGFVTFDLSFLQRVGRANLVSGAAGVVDFEIEPGKAGYIVEHGNNLSFRWGPGRSGLKLARERQLVVELAARIVRGNPVLKLYIIYYNSNGLRLRQSTFRLVRDRFHGSLTLARDVATYMLAIRVAGRGIVEFGEFQTFRDSADIGSDRARPLAISGSAPPVRVTRKYLVARVADTISRLDRRHFAKGVDLALHGARQLKSRVAVFAEKARGAAGANERAEKDGSAVGTAADRPQFRLRKLNGDLALHGKSDPTGWQAEALEFALAMGCCETAERLARYVLAIWPQMEPSNRRKILTPLVEALLVVGDSEAARALLETNSSAVLLSDRLITRARALGLVPVGDPANFLLPSGKLDAFSLSRAPIGDGGLIASVYRTKKRLFAMEPQNFLLMCSTALGKSEALYCKYLNKCLTSFDVGHATEVTFGENILGDIRFRRGPPMTGGPLVSVIMAASNAALTVRYAMRSILLQEYRNIEFLICDDASSDDTMAEIVREAGGDERVRVFRSDRHQGICNAGNALLDVAKGEYVTFHDAADFALPSRIGSEIATILARRPRAVIARLLRVRPSGEFVFFEDQSALRSAPVSVMAARETFLRHGPYGPLHQGIGRELMEQIRNSDGSIHQMKQPLLLSPWTDISPSRHPGSEGLEDECREAARRRLAEISARQKLLGSEAVPEFEVVAALAKTGRLLEPSPLSSVGRS